MDENLEHGRMNGREIDDTLIPNCRQRAPSVGIWTALFGGYKCLICQDVIQCGTLVPIQVRGLSLNAS